MFIMSMSATAPQNNEQNSQNCCVQNTCNNQLLGNRTNSHCIPFACSEHSSVVTFMTIVVMFLSWGSSHVKDMLVGAASTTTNNSNIGNNQTRSACHQLTICIRIDFLIFTHAYNMESPQFSNLLHFNRPTHI